MSIEILRKIYSDFAAVEPNLHPDFALHAAGDSPVSGEFRGLAGFVEHVGEMQRLSNNTMKLEPLSFMADGDWGLVVSNLAAERNGKKLDMTGFGLWRFRDGKLIDHWEAVADQALLDDFWS